MQTIVPAKKVVAKYPCFVRPEEFGLSKRIQARMSRCDLGHNRYLGYCHLHKKYFVDHLHTNWEIRCPLCEENWLAKHRYSHTYGLTYR